MRCIIVLLVLCFIFGAFANDEVPPPSEPADPLAGMDDPQTLSQLLQWSLANQDLDKLHVKAEALRAAQGLDGATGDLDAPPTDPDLGAAKFAANQQPRALTPERKAELDELAKVMMPNMVATMRELLGNGTDTTLPVDEREEALLGLADLVEDIDHARDLKSIGGFPEIVALLAAEDAPLVAAASLIIGSSVKNHRELQLHLLEERALPSLLALLSSHSDGEVRSKAFYATSTIVRNCPEAQVVFGQGGGMHALLGVLGTSGSGLDSIGRPGGGAKLVRKALLLQQLKQRFLKGCHLAGTRVC